MRCFLSHFPAIHIHTLCPKSESVSHHLHVPVLSHSSPKPGYSCIAGIRRYFSSLRSPIRDEELIVVGDRIFTDVVMANRMRKSRRLDPVETSREVDAQGSSTSGPLAVWTTGVWHKEAMVMRWCENKLVEAVRRWTESDGGNQLNTHQFRRDFIEPPRKRAGIMQGLFGVLRRSS